MTKTTASPVGDAARSRRVGAPATSIALVSGAVANVACWPGMSVATLPLSSEDRRLPSPGSDEMAPGFPFGGLAIGWAGPVTLTWVFPLPVIPGYEEVEYPFVTRSRSSALNPATRDQVKSSPGASPEPFR